MQNHKLLNLLRDNLQSKRVFDVVASEDGTNIYLYDAIDPYFGVSAEAFVQALNAITAPKINLHINSPGGDVFEARAIAVAIRQHASHITAHIDGLAASAATYVAISAKDVAIADGAFMMVHQAWTLAYGNSADMRTVADLLGKIDATIAAGCGERAGKAAADVAAWMSAETWFSAQEAIDAGLADRLVAVDANGGASNQWNLTAYANTPKALTEPKPKPAAPAYDRGAMERRLKLYEPIAA